MYLLSQYSMISTVSTTLIFGLIFLLLARQNRLDYMKLWGFCWILYSAIFLLDLTSLTGLHPANGYIVIRQALSLISALLFLLATHRFFQLYPSKYLYLAALLSLSTIMASACSAQLYAIIVVPNIMFSTLLLIWSGCMFISYSWTQSLPEKVVASFLMILWAVFSNHFGFTLNHIAMATFNYFIGLFTVNLLILLLMIIHFKKTRFLLVKREDRYRLLVENSSDSMFLYHYKKHIFQYISPSVQQHLGVSAAELYLSPERFFSQITLQEESQELLRIFRQPIRLPSMAVICLLKEGQPYRWSEMHYLPIFDALGNPIAVEGILRDITERKKIEESLKNSESSRKELVENISHELRTPITLIQGYLESMLNEVIPPASVPLYLKMIHAKTQMLDALLEDLIQVSHFTSQTLAYQFYELNAQDYFSTLIGQAEFQVKRSDRTFTGQNDVETQLMIILDPSRIEQVISNLISNSIRHTPVGKSISVTCTQDKEEMMLPEQSEREPSSTIPDGEIIFTVTDTGNGIAPEDLPHIFERNFQGKNRHNTKPNQNSAGLGLYISLQIIKQHSGRMWAKNNPAGGTIISFSLPYYRPCD